MQFRFIMVNTSYRVYRLNKRVGGLILARPVSSGALGEINFSILEEEENTNTNEWPLPITVCKT